MGFDTITDLHESIPGEKIKFQEINENFNFLYREIKRKIETQDEQADCNQDDIQELSYIKNLPNFDEFN